uniref:BHLH domain-containing protein n=1 Tax=Seriola lalandi dorsalis TaxID=1841481 RepID=A0A3B4X1Y5_SERLL
MSPHQSGPHATEAAFHHQAAAGCQTPPPPRLHPWWPAPLPSYAAYLDPVHGHMLPYRRLSYFPFHGSLGVCDYSFEPAFIRKRNERERHRVRCVNEGYARLREHLPQEFEDKRLSKVETLRAAIDYIKHLQSLLDLNVSGMEMSLGDARNRAPLFTCGEAGKTVFSRWTLEAKTIILDQYLEFHS